jgi:hypothetical protein
MDNPQDAPSTGPTIVESYRDFDPPPNFKGLIETLLRCVPPKYLIGLKSVILTSRSGSTRDKCRQKVWSRKRKVRLAEALGSYAQATRSSSATVWIYVDNLVDNASWMLRAPFIRYMVPREVLYHEIVPYSQGPQTSSRGTRGSSTGLESKVVCEFRAHALLVLGTCLARRDS